MELHHCCCIDQSLRIFHCRRWSSPLDLQPRSTTIWPGAWSGYIRASRRKKNTRCTIMRRKQPSDRLNYRSGVSQGKVISTTLCRLGTMSIGFERSRTNHLSACTYWLMTSAVWFERNSIPRPVARSHSGPVGAMHHVRSERATSSGSRGSQRLPRGYRSVSESTE